MEGSLEKVVAKVELDYNEYLTANKVTERFYSNHYLKKSKMLPYILIIAVVLLVTIINGNNTNNTVNTVPVNPVNPIPWYIDYLPFIFVAVIISVFLFVALKLKDFNFPSQLVV